MKRLGIRGTPVVTYSEDMLQSQVARTRALAIARVNRWFEDPHFPVSLPTPLFFIFLSDCPLLFIRRQPALPVALP